MPKTPEPVKPTLDTDQLLLDAIRDGIRKGVQDKLACTYGEKPLDKLILASLAKHDAAFRAMLDDAIGSAIGDESFRAEIRQSIRHTLAKTLVARFGGELEKQVNVLKSDPVTRARITTAIDQIVKERCTT